MVDIVVPTGERDLDDAVVAALEASPVGLGHVHEAGQPRGEGHSVDALAVVSIERAVGDGVDLVGVVKKLALRHCALAELLLSEDPGLDRQRPALWQVGVVHDVVAEDHRLPLLDADGNVVVAPVGRVQGQGASAAAHKVDDTHLAPVVEGKVALDHAGTNGVAPGVVEKVEFLLRVCAVHVHHGVAPADTIEAEVRRYVADAERHARQLLVDVVKAGSLALGIVTRLSAYVPLHALAVRALAHIHGLKLRHEARPVVQVLHLSADGFLVALLERHLHNAVLLLRQGRGEVRLKGHGPALRLREGKVEAALLDRRRLELLQVVLSNRHKVAIEGLHNVLVLLLDPSERLALLAIDVDLLRRGVLLKGVGCRRQGRLVNDFDELVLEGGHPYCSKRGAGRHTTTRPLAGTA
mmetsp:Transcript_4634/g.12435  ORF Transcript_4634/g.12435 Transcript_4634/m.12435 type:complete len:410 (+) Transcript_4634:1426-2655(+)